MQYFNSKKWTGAHLMNVSLLFRTGKDLGYFYATSLFVKMLEM